MIRTILHDIRKSLIPGALATAGLLFIFGWLYSVLYVAYALGRDVGFFDLVFLPILLLVLGMLFLPVTIWCFVKERMDNRKEDDMRRLDK